MCVVIKLTISDVLMPNEHKPDVSQHKVFYCYASVVLHSVHMFFSWIFGTNHPHQRFRLISLVIVVTNLGYLLVQQQVNLCY